MNKQKAEQVLTFFFSLVMLMVGVSLCAPQAWAKEKPTLRPITKPQQIMSKQTGQAATALSARDLYFIRSGYDSAWAADGEAVFIATNLTGRVNIWKVPASGGFPMQLTQSEQSQVGLAPSPDGAWLVFESDDSGKEIFDLYRTPADGGQVINLTQTPDFSERDAVFSADGKQLAFARRAKSKPSHDVVLMTFPDQKVLPLTKEESPNMQWSVVGFEQTGTYLYVNRSSVDQSQSNVYQINLKTKEKKPLFEEGDGIIHMATDVAHAGQHLALTVQKDGRLRAAMYDLSKQKLDFLLDEPWEQYGLHFSPDGKQLLFRSNTNGRDNIYAYDVVRRHTKLLSFKQGMNSDERGKLPAYSPDGKKLLFVHESGNQSPDYWLMDVATQASKPLTRLGLASIRSEHIPQTEIVTYQSSDGTPVSGVLWVPFNLKRDGSAPAVVIAHGGPTWQMKDRFNPLAAALVSRGYLVLAPNPRGSTGYGKAFREANRMDLGGGDLDDLVAGARFLTNTGYVDEEKIGITGASYGGYLTLMALGRTPDVWAAGVEVYGIVNWFSMWENGSPQLRFYQESLIGHPVKDKATYNKSSPMTYLHQVKAPMLILQGDNDLRVPKEQAVQVEETLRKAGQVVDATYYPNEGHGFYKRENQIDALERTVEWFDRHVKHQTQ